MSCRTLTRVVGACMTRRQLDARVPPEEADGGWKERSVVGGLSLSAIALWCAGLRQRSHWIVSGPSTLLALFTTEVVGTLRILLALSPGLILALQVRCDAMNVAAALC